MIAKQLGYQNKQLPSHLRQRARSFKIKQRSQMKEQEKKLADELISWQKIDKRTLQNPGP